MSVLTDTEGLIHIVSLLLTSNITLSYFWYQDVQNLFAAVVKLLDSGDIIRVDQEHLETVIPALGTVNFPWMHVIMIVLIFITEINYLTLESEVF